MEDRSRPVFKLAIAVQASDGYLHEISAGAPAPRKLTGMIDWCQSRAAGPWDAVLDATRPGPPGVVFYFSDRDTASRFRERWPLP